MVPCGVLAQILKMFLETKYGNMSAAAKVVQRDVSWVTDAVNRVNPNRLRTLLEILDQQGLLHKEFVLRLAAKLDTMERELLTGTDKIQTLQKENDNLWQENSRILEQLITHRNGTALRSERVSEAG